MTREEMVSELKGFVVNEFLDGRDSGLDEDTPLLEWGVIDSISVSMMIQFTSERFGIEVPQEEVKPENVKSLGAYVSLLERLESQAASR